MTLTTLTLILLLTFGFIYNLLVWLLEIKGYHEGYVAILVIGGVAMTGVGFRTVMISFYGPEVGSKIADWFFYCFAASGLFMALGSWLRHGLSLKAAGRERKRELQRILERECKRGKNGYGSRSGEDEMEQRHNEGNDSH